MTENTLAHDTQNARPVDLARERVEALVKTANDWVAKVREITDSETAARAQTFIEQIDKETKRILAEEKAEVDPLRKAIEGVKLLYDPLKLLLSSCKEAIAPKRKTWLEREQKRLNTEKAAQILEANRLAQEAAKLAKWAAAGPPSIDKRVAALQAQETAERAQAEAARPAERAQLRGLYSARAASVRTTWRAEVVDQLQAYIYYAAHSDMIALLTKLGNAEAPAAHREGREIPGYKLIKKEVAA